MTVDDLKRVNKFLSELNMMYLEQIEKKMKAGERPDKLISIQSQLSYACICIDELFNQIEMVQRENSQLKLDYQRIKDHCIYLQSKIDKLTDGL